MERDGRGVKPSGPFGRSGGAQIQGRRRGADLGEENIRQTMSELSITVGRDTALSASLLEKSRALTAFLSEESPKSESVGRLTERTMKALLDAGLFHLYVPRCVGGAELWPVEALEIIESLSYGDGSAGWVVMATQVSMGTAAAFLQPSVVQEIFGNGIPLIAGQGAPIGRAEPKNGGYQLSGNWSYGSGLLHSTWIHTGALVYEGAAPRKYPGAKSVDARIFILPVKNAELKNNWDVLGLRATGSIDYDVKDVFVAEEFTHRISANRPLQGGDLYRLGISGLAVTGHTGFALGVARRALDELKTLAMAPSHRPSLLAERGGGQSFREQFGRAEAQLRAARALVYEAWNDAQSTIQKGCDLSVRQTTLTKLALTHVTAVAAETTAFAYKYGGGTAARVGPLQRCFRDMHTGLQHIVTSPLVLDECSKELLGLSKGLVWASRQMVAPD
jgi:alkylation response protein AidB-like acyl-CoA dehydrogenase